MTSTSTTRLLPAEIRLNITEHLFTAVVTAPMKQRLDTNRSILPKKNVGYEAQRALDDLVYYLQVFPDMLEHIDTLLRATWLRLSKRLAARGQKSRAPSSVSSASTEEGRAAVGSRSDRIFVEWSIVCCIMEKFDAWTVSAR